MSGIVAVFWVLWVLPGFHEVEYGYVDVFHVDYAVAVDEKTEKFLSIITQKRPLTHSAFLFSPSIEVVSHTHTSIKERILIHKGKISETGAQNC